MLLPVLLHSFGMGAAVDFIQGYIHKPSKRLFITFSVFLLTAYWLKWHNSSDCTFLSKWPKQLR